MANERLSTRVFAVVIVEFRLRFEAFGADVTDKFAVARMELGMPLEKGNLLEALVAALVITYKCFGRSHRGRRDDGSHSAAARVSHSLDNGHLLPTCRAKNVAAAPTGGDDGRASLAGVDQALDKGCVGTQHRASGSGVQVSHGGHFAFALVLGILLQRQGLGASKNLTDGNGQRLAVACTGHLERAVGQVDDVSGLAWLDGSRGWNNKRL